jgi:hypothetical protein
MKASMLPEASTHNSRPRASGNNTLALNSPQGFSRNLRPRASSSVLLDNLDANRLRPPVGLPDVE